MAGGGEFATAVWPFILRGVNLLGINSVRVERTERLRIWERLSRDAAVVAGFDDWDKRLARLADDLDQLADRQFGLAQQQKQAQPRWVARCPEHGYQPVQAFSHI